MPRSREIVFSTIRTLAAVTAADSGLPEADSFVALQGNIDHYAVPELVRVAFTDYSATTAPGLVTFEAYSLVQDSDGNEVMACIDQITYTPTDFAKNPTWDLAVFAVKIYIKVAAITGTTPSFSLTVRARALN